MDIAFGMHAGSLQQEFVYSGSAKAVHVAGTFNGWSRFVHPLKQTSQGVWKLSMRVPIGRHLYKLVINGEEWKVDPRAADSETDSSGNTNSVLNALPQDFGQPARKGDGNISVSVVHHQPLAPLFWVDQGKATIGVNVRPNDVEKVTAIVNGVSHPLAVKSAGKWVERREVTLPLTSKGLSYHLALKDGSKTLTLGAAGLGSKAPFKVTETEAKAMAFPQWPRGAVVYQIFADRFENGSKANDPSGTGSWDSAPTYNSWSGGDAAGVVKRIPYLKDLGVQAIYFNPVFDSPSNHRYDTTNYRLIDRRFGSNQEFIDLTQKLESQGIRTVLDGVFNHTSTDFFTFRSLLQQQQQSPYQDWHFVRSWPVTLQGRPTYEAWNGFGAMPKVNLSHGPAREHMFGAVDFWNKRARVHGWRLDVAGEVQVDFWREFRTRLKRDNPQSWVVGEVWTDGAPWLGGDQWDSIMGYQFRDAAIKFIAKGKGTASETLGSLLTVFGSVAPPVGHSLMNLLGSHDTPRWLRECGGSRELAHLGAILLLTWPGAPSIYYGDELLMDGGQDPDNRRGMTWERAKASPTLGLYRRLIQLRRSTPALRTGDPVALGAWDDRQTLAFGRSQGSSRTVVAINRSNSAQTVSISLPPSWRKWSSQPLRDALGAAPVTRLSSGAIRLSLAPLSGAIILPRSGK
jgi:cyclomaltodextrinase / maltogenic alpha-amylase / neopullulanase